MQRVCAGNTVKGIDVSHYQPKVDWHEVKRAGYEFAFLKASEGHSPDLMFKAHRASAREAGVLTGAYHFFHPSQDPSQQAKFFLGQVGALQPGDLPCVLDWEATDGMPGQADRERGFLFLDAVERATGHAPIIYGSPYFLQALSLDLRFARFPLWVAHYGVSCPLVPAPFVTWTFWQSFDKGQVPGVGRDDVNVFNGDLASLKRFAVG